MGVNAEFPEEILSSVFTPRKENLTKLLTSDAHQQVHHARASHTLASLRQNFWLPQSRTELKEKVKSFLACVQYHGWPYENKRSHA